MGMSRFIYSPIENLYLRAPIKYKIKYIGRVMVLFNLNTVVTSVGKIYYENASTFKFTIFSLRLIDLALSRTIINCSALCNLTHCWYRMNFGLQIRCNFYI